MTATVNLWGFGEFSADEVGILFGLGRRTDLQIGQPRRPVKIIMSVGYKIQN
jgi:hypothetical protein